MTKTLHGAYDARGPAARREARLRSADYARLTLVRHADPDWNPGGGPSVNDPGLTVFGKEQARAIAKTLAAERIDALYVSPYRRAQETAAALVETTGLEPIRIDGLREIGINVGGLSQTAVDRYFIEAMKRPLHEHWEGWPKSESFRDFHARVTRSLADILARHGMQAERVSEFTVWHLEKEPPSLVIVGHGGTNAVLLAHLLDIEPVPWEWLRFESELAAYSVVQARPMGTRGHVWALQNFNELDHLRAAGLR